jgi:hypothetical protein
MGLDVRVQTRAPRMKILVHVQRLLLHELHD